MRLIAASNKVRPGIWVSPFSFATIGVMCLLCFRVSTLQAQHFVGVGFHLTPPIHLEYRQNPYVNATPRPGLAGSVFYKKEWQRTKKRAWYGALGLTTQGLRYYQITYTADQEVIWSDYTNQHTGFPSLLVGGGYIRRLFQGNGFVSAGLEGTLNIVQDLEEIWSSSFHILNDPSKHHVFPLFCRLNLAYGHDIPLFKQHSGQLQLYASLSPQKITKGTMYIRNLHDGSAVVEGRYHVNNSELGVKFMATLGKKQPQQLPAQRPPTPEWLLQKSKTGVRFSVYAQLFRPALVRYHIPQVDSFSISSRKFTLNQEFGITAEWPFKRHPAWAAVVQIGAGRRIATLQFSATGAYSSTGTPVEAETEIANLGFYGVVNAGISRRHGIGNLLLSHQLSGSVVAPLHQENVYFGVSKNAPDNALPPYVQPIVEGSVSHQFGRNNTLFGMEYHPELIFSKKKDMFWAVGLVGNYSFGVISQGRFTVSNQKTAYYGALIQPFSKIGLTLRVGFQKAK
jgi:hypothetical protein